MADPVTFAGTTGSQGYFDGPGAEAQFNRPSSCEYDPLRGLIMVADRSNFLIRGVDPVTAEVTTLTPATYPNVNAVFRSIEDTPATNAIVSYRATTFQRVDKTDVGGGSGGFTLQDYADPSSNIDIGSFTGYHAIFGRPAAGTYVSYHDKSAADTAHYKEYTPFQGGALRQSASRSGSAWGVTVDEPNLRVWWVVANADSSIAEVLTRPVNSASAFTSALTANNARFKYPHVEDDKLYVWKVNFPLGLGSQDSELWAYTIAGDSLADGEMICPEDDDVAGNLGKVAIVENRIFYPRGSPYHDIRVVELTEPPPSWVDPGPSSVRVHQYGRRR